MKRRLIIKWAATAYLRRDKRLKREAADAHYKLKMNRWVFPAFPAYFQSSRDKKADMFFGL
jgi:hypothetical protein